VSIFLPAINLQSHLMIQKTQSGLPITKSKASLMRQGDE